MQGMRRTKAVLGLDLGAGAIKAVELARGGLRSCAFAPRRQGGSDASGSSAGAALRSALAAAAPRATRAVVGLGASEVIVHRFSLPADLPPEEIEEQARLQASQAGPYPLEEACYDYVTRETGGRGRHYLMGIARSAAVRALCRPVEEAGLEVAAVDVTSFAVQRSVPLPENQDHALAVLDGGHRQTRLTLYCGREPIFQHSQPFGCEELAERLRAAYGLSQSDTLKAVAECAGAGGPDSGIRESFVRDLARHAARALQLYLASRSDARNPESMLLWGGAALVHGADRTLRETLGMPVSVADPLKDSASGTKEPNYSPVFLGAHALARNDHG